jgi:REP element-mobilizing transposase RayT
MSRAIASDLIAELGQLHYGRKRVQPSTRTLREFFDRAKDNLKFERAEFSPHDVKLIADAIGETIRSRVYTCYACAIMPDHVHLVIRKHKHTAEEMIAHFQEASRLKLLDANLREPNHPVWGGPGWKVFLDSPDDIRRTIPYVQDNPIKTRRQKQVWDFVKGYDGWPFHAGSRMRMR